MLATGTLYNWNTKRSYLVLALSPFKAADDVLAVDDTEIDANATSGVPETTE